MLGPLQIVDGEREVALTGTGRRGLLALLLLHANEVVSADRLIDELWPQEPPSSGPAALQVRLSHLRKALGDSGKRVVTRPPGYVLEVGRNELDVYRFEELLAEAEHAEPAAAAALLREALGLWRGPALADLAYEAFAQPAIARLEELRLVALERRIEADLALGRHGELVPELESLVAAQPRRERLRGQLMLALYRSGRQADALAAFQEGRASLVGELGIEPGPALRQLELAILRQDPGLDLAGTERPERSLLVAALEDADLEPLLALAASLATRPKRELIVARLVAGEAQLGAASDVLRSLQNELAARDLVVRTAAFTAGDPARDVVRLATEQHVDLLLFAGSVSPLDDAVTRAVLASAPCDVGILIARDSSPGPVLAPFAGAEHDWTAIEIGAWVAGATGVRLRLVGPREPGRDASRILATASLATQRAFGVTAEPLLVEPGPDGLLGAAEEASLVVVGLTERWQRDGLGEVRGALATHARPPVLLVRSGLRPGGLAPGESLTRFTWSIR
jgi:DNA-binding SARP family transcriptional activator